MSGNSTHALPIASLEATPIPVEFAQVRALDASERRGCCDAAVVGIGREVSDDGAQWESQSGACKGEKRGEDVGKVHLVVGWKCLSVCGEL